MTRLGLFFMRIEKRRMSVARTNGHELQMTHGGSNDEIGRRTAS